MQRKRILQKELIFGAGEDQVQEAVNKAMSNAMEGVTKDFILTMMAEDHGTNPEESRGSRTEVLRRSC